MVPKSLVANNDSAFTDHNPWANCCGRKNATDIYGDTRERVRRGCVSPCMAPVRWSPDDLNVPAPAAAWMGETPPDNIIAPYIKNAPIEDPENGCPGGWIHSPFIQDLYPFMRNIGSHGGREDNLLLDGAWWVVRQCISEFEYFEDWSRAEKQNFRIDIQKKQTAKKPSRGEKGDRLL